MKKQIAGLLALLLLVSVLAGCGGTTTDDKPTKQTEEVKQTEATKAPTQAPTLPVQTQPVVQPTLPVQTQPIVQPTLPVQTQPIMQPTLPVQTQPIVQPTLPVQTQPIVQPTLPVNGEADIGTILSAPEAVYQDTIEKIFLSYTSVENGVAEQADLAFDASLDDLYLVYFKSGSTEGVLEADQNGNITGYTRESQSVPFALDTEATQEELAGTFNDLLAIFLVLTLDEEEFAGVQYQKIAPIASATGAVYSYNTIYNGQVTGTVSVDKASGVAVYINTNGTTITVNILDLTSSRIPAYKTSTQPTTPVAPTEPAAQPTLPTVTATNYDGILAQLGIYGHVPGILNMDITSFVGVTDSCINFIDFGSKDGIIVEWEEALYYPISGLSTAQVNTLKEQLTAAFQKFNDLQCGQMYFTSNNTYLIVNLEFKDLDKPQNYSELCTVGLSNENAPLNLTKSIQATIANGFVKK